MWVDYVRPGIERAERLKAAAKGDDGPELPDEMFLAMLESMGILKPRGPEKTDG